MKASALLQEAAKLGWHEGLGCLYSCVDQALDIGCPGKAKVTPFTDVIPRRPTTEGRLLAALPAVED